jgi:hypothetical protein
MSLPPKTPVPMPPPPRSRRDTLDDAERELDAVHEVTDPISAYRDASTAVEVDAETNPLDGQTDPLGSRELPTGPAEQRTAPWMQASPWAAVEPEKRTQRDPWLVPVVLAVLLLLAFIGYFVYQETHKPRFETSPLSALPPETSASALCRHDKRWTVTTFLGSPTRLGHHGATWLFPTNPNRG